jgi:WD40 repeat protein
MIERREFQQPLPMTREPYQLVLRAPASRLGKPLQLNDRGPSDSFYVIPQQPEKNFRQHTVETLTCEMGFMSRNVGCEASTNTEYRIEKNQILQTNFELNDGSLDDKGKEALKKFLAESTRLIEEILTTNEVINIYEDDLSYGQNSAEKLEQLKEQEEQMTIKELKCFEHESCKQKIVSRICFQPDSDLIAVSLREIMSFEDGIESNGKSSEAFVAIWNSFEFHRFTPVAILHCPLEVTAMTFKPDDPTTLIVGAVNGQIFLFDLTDITPMGKPLNDRDPMAHRNTNLNMSGLTFSEIKTNYRNSLTPGKKIDGTAFLRPKMQGSDQGEISTIKPLLMSAVLESHAASQNLTPLEVFSKKIYHFSSHRTSVKSIKFLPAGHMLEKKNPMNIITAKEGERWPCDQFVSLSEDGQLLFWDLNFNDKNTGKANTELEFSKLVWRAILSIQLFKPDQNLYSTRCFAEGANHKTELMIGGEEGELFLINFNSKESTNEDLNKFEVIKKTWGIRSKLTNLFSEISRNIQGLFLAANDLTFSLFYHSIQTSIFTSSPVIGTRITCVRFSVGRSSVIFVGREDGIIDVWDLADQTGSPSQQHLVSAVGISFIETSERKPHILAVGDKDGSLHLLQLPKALFKPVGSEERIMEKFIQKEISRIAYYNTKYSDLEVQAQQRREKAEAEEELNGLKLDDFKSFVGQNMKSEDDLLEEAYIKFVEENRAKLAKATP